MKIYWKTFRKGLLGHTVDGRINLWQNWIYVDQDILIGFKYFNEKFSMFSDENDAGSCLIYNAQ